MMVVSFRRVADALEAILEDRVPEVVWKTAIAGPVFPKQLTGYLCCDSIEYSPYVKGESITEAVFLIEIICPNPKEAPDSTTPVEDIAMKVREVLAEERTLDGWAEDSSVYKITFATPAGMNATGAAILEYHVKYEE